MSVISRVFSENDPKGFELVTVQSGVRSLRSRDCGETFHPVVGPMTEAVGLHVRQQRLIERARLTGGAFVIWDVGLGAAANAIAVIDAVKRAELKTHVDLHSFDRTDAPLRFALSHAEELGYMASHTELVQALLENGRVSGVNWEWTCHAGDFAETMSLAPPPHAILYDPYSPQSNPGMWTLDHFTRLRARLSNDAPCLLTNYTRSTAVRVTLLLAGFFVGRGHATGEKDETTIAGNHLAEIEEPLDIEWLQRVHRSTNSAPLRPGRTALSPICAEDWSMLSTHPQFARCPSVE